jgi:hypothetical protein
MKVEILDGSNLIDYHDHDLDKEVKFNDELLQKASIKYNDKHFDLVKEHQNITLGKASGLSYEDNKLYVDVPDNLDIKNKGFSPAIQTWLVETPDYYEVADMDIINIGVTEKPRNMILYNSIQDDSKSNNDSLLLRELESKNNEINKLKEQLAKSKENSEEINKVKKLLEDNKEFLDNKEDILNELASFRNKAKQKEISEIAEKYGFDIKNKEEEAIIERIRNKDIDFELMEKLVERKAKLEENNLEENIDNNSPPGKVNSNSQNKQKRDETPEIKNRADYNKILDELGLASEKKVF